MRTLNARHAGPRLRREDGAAMVEFALVLPIMLALAFAVAEFSRAFNYFTDMTHLAATAARYAAVNKNPGPEPTLSETIAARALNDQLREGVIVCVDYPDGNGIGDYVHVTVTYDLTFIDFLTADLPLLPSLSSATETITATADMRLERVPTDVPAGCNGGA